MFKGRLTFVVVLGALVILLNLPNFIRSEPTLQDLGIRVVNVKKVYNECLLKKELEAELEVWTEEERKKLEALRKDVEAVRIAMHAVERNSPKYIELREQWLQKKALYEARLDQSEIEMKELAATNMQKLYSAIRNAIQKYALDHRLLLVLKVDDAEISNVSPDTASDQINYRSVLHSEQSIDITEEIIEMVNSTIRKEGR